MTFIARANEQLYLQCSYRHTIMPVSHLKPLQTNTHFPYGSYLSVPLL